MAIPTLASFEWYRRFLGGRWFTRNGRWMWCPNQRDEQVPISHPHHIYFYVDYRKKSMKNGKPIIRTRAVLCDQIRLQQVGRSMRTKPPFSLTVLSPTDMDSRLPTDGR